MLDIHSKVPWILHMPSMKHINHNSGRKVICGAIRLQTNTPNAADVSNVLFVNGTSCGTAREVDSHTCEIGVHTHQYILTHQCHSPDHLVQCSQIDPARKLESNGNEQINPRLYLPRYEATEHGHHERAI